MTISRHAISFSACSSLNLVALISSGLNVFLTPSSHRSGIFLLLFIITIKTRIEYPFLVVTKLPTRVPNHRQNSSEKPANQHDLHACENSNKRALHTSKQSTYCTEDRKRFLYLKRPRVFSSSEGRYEKSHCLRPLDLEMSREETSLWFPDRYPPRCFFFATPWPEKDNSIASRV